ncbi:hypothetical protein J437_LFUL015447 [Ladona fulva]|uniref:DDE Tnp4 domain-containing protein n=1 Tax=Ladona fulva TaxID=123851 RepID=A0A8K0KA41_LADFU|nr:hypothetical protein J437_LFUL015447 [Ladona fulva]
MEANDDYFFLDSPLLKLLLIEGGKTEHVNKLFAARNEKGEFQMFFKDLLSDAKEFFGYFRMTPATFKYILKGIEESITKYSNFRDCISAEERLAVTLRISHYAVRNIVYEMCEAIWDGFCKQHLPLPTTDQWKSIASDFYNKWNFPNCIGCIDGKHVRIRCPKETGSMFFNYKRYFTVVLQGIADANLKFIAVEVGAYGKQSDGGTFSDSNVYQQLEMNTFNISNNENIPSTDISAPFVLLGDDAYPLKTYLLKPYSRVRLNQEERIFNYRLSRARRCVECAFGILTAKWRCLKTELQLDPGKVNIVVKCLCLLHNILIDKEGISSLEIPIESATMGNGSVSRRYNHYCRNASENREVFKNYLVSLIGEVQFQYNIL